MDIEKLTDQQFAVFYHKFIQKIKDDPIKNFVRAQALINFEPSPAQEVILKIIFNIKLDDEQKRLMTVEDKDQEGNLIFRDEYMTEVEIYKFLTETDYVWEENPDERAIINKINLICGRRSGKTTICAIIAIYVAISTNWKPFLKKTPFATVLILSHSREFSDEVLEIIRTMIEASPILSRLINLDKKNTQSTMNLKVPFIVDKSVEYSRVQIKVGAASSKTTRGVAACCVICDEIAYWNISEDAKETDEKILRAVRPAQKQFGKYAMLLKLSSPGPKSGLLYNEYTKWQTGSLPKAYAVFKAPTWAMNGIIPREELVEEWQLDPDAFDTEYRSNFVDSISNFIVPQYVDLAIMKGVQFMAPENGWVYKAAIDAAFKGDAFTFSIVGTKDNRVRQFVLKGWKGTKAAPVKAHEVAAWIKTACKEFDLNEVAADQYSFQPLKEIFEQYGVVLTENSFTPKFKKQIYFNLKKLFHSQQIDILDVEILAKEIKQLVVEQTGTGNVKIGHPQGGSDDYSDSTAIAAYLCTEASGQGSFNFESALPIQTHGVKVDQHGRAITQAPSAEMLAEVYGYHISDNASEYVLDPKTNKLVHQADLEDDLDDGISFSF